MFDTMSDFAHNIRNQSTLKSIVNVHDNRMQIYQELIYNNINSILKRAFPVSFSILTSSQWHKLVKGFIKDHSATSPYFYHIPKQFVDYLNGLPKLSFPFLVELMHYEWIELEVEISPDYQPKEIIDNKDTLIRNTSTRVLIYQFPVHQICRNYLPLNPPLNPTFLIVYRNYDFKVCFMEVNLLSAHLVEVFESGFNIDTALKITSDNLLLTFNDDFVIAGRALCESFLRKNILTHL